MKTRIIHTRIWQDEWFSSLNRASSIIYLYLLTCPENNLSSVFELPDRVILFNTKTTQQELEQAKQDFKNKVSFSNGWIKIHNVGKYQSYSGSKNELAKEKEIKQVPPEILDTLSIPYRYPIDSLSNQKSVIRNKKSVIRKEEKGLDSLTDEYLREVSAQLGIPYKVIAKKRMDIDLYCKSTGKKYKNYRATLLNWLRKDGYAE